MIHLAPSEADLHAYVDGQLDASARAEIERWLAAHPERAAVVADWKRDAERLRVQQALPEHWPANPLLDPARLRRQVRARRRTRLGMAAAMALSLCVGVGLGWQAKQAQNPVARLPMADAVAAYRLFATSDTLASLDSASPAQLRDWLALHFGALDRVPDLSAQGFHLVGGQRLSTEQGAAAMLVYADAQGTRLGLYVRPGGWFRRPGQRRDGDLLAQYWSRGDASFAVVSPFDDPRARSVASALAPRG
ncbi:MULTISPECIES: anti-sigma factor [Pseudoxanthomonas]|uniref:Anti-sigma factor n=1 Tax=Pseudoxanthomonas winnipegensis TaxID=2480810 RepID=A0A4Q8M4L6_9GAMM|nr:MULTISPECIES: anti-sigma factor [Pseudoxanthomonas]MDQ1120969.1 anti-sigma factor RsiW [Pseudoxanthomonas winnipegensis]MDQ1134198.1 anti-sigma factor RsiW [Pseudoxanthomonas winnipegensis]MDR6139566.1 anti-sigma factor RsiW [Pseudoxanthomonas sp. SORGH_AS_0997]TAA43352.1 anti-sigma factor [Pseudoxanthomonas winnipegensis]WJI15704.1 anti-sigma factor [Pseudoxanthomonas winnipegensis]